MFQNIASSEKPKVDARCLEAELRAAIRGEVRFSNGDRALYSTDSSNYCQIPIGVVIPRDRNDVIAIVALCRTFGAPITSRGGGTNLRVGRTSDAELDRIISDGGRRGEIYKQLIDLRDKYGELVKQKFPKIPRRVSGYNLDDLLPEKHFHVGRALVGTEGTCVLILEATLELIADPPVRSLVVLGYPDIYQAGDHISEVRKYKPIGL